MSNEIAFIRVDSLGAPLPDDLLLELRPKLKSLGFSEEHVAPYANKLRGPSDRIALLHATEAGTPLDVMCRLWQMSRWVDRDAAEEALGKELLTRACEWALLADIDGRVGATVDLYPLGDDLIATDRQIVPGSFEDCAYPLGGDSYSLSRMIPQRRVGKALDLCTGSGVQALTVKADLVHAVELSERAFDFAFFNLSLNRPKDSVRVFKGDLYEPLPYRNYDLIVSNPPWVPAPTDEMELYRGGGSNGELITKRIVEGLPGHLAPDGWFVMYVEYPLYGNDTYHERLRKWLGEGTWGIASLKLAEFKAQQYVQGQVSSHDPKTMAEDYLAWLNLYEKEGIQAMGYAVVFARRAQEPWDVTIKGLPPQEPQTWVEDWMDALYAPAEGPAELSPHAKMWVSGEEAKIEWPGTCLSTIDLTSEEFAAVRGENDDPALLTSLRRRLILK